jgi:hypothetical protein
LNWWGIDRYALQAIEDEKWRILRDPIRTEALRWIRYGEEGENKFIVVGDNPLKELSFWGWENLIYWLYGRDGINCLNQIDVWNENTNIGMILVTGTNIWKMWKHPSWGIVKPRLVSTPQEIIRLNVYAIKAEEIGHSTRNHIRMQRKGLTSYYDRRRVSGESIRLPIQTALYPNCITGRIKVWTKKKYPRPKSSVHRNQRWFRKSPLGGFGRLARRRWWSNSDDKPTSAIRRAT